MQSVSSSAAYQWLIFILIWSVISSICWRRFLLTAVQLSLTLTTSCISNEHFFKVLYFKAFLPIPPWFCFFSRLCFLLSQTPFGCLMPLETAAVLLCIKKKMQVSPQNQSAGASVRSGFGFLPRCGLYHPLCCSLWWLRIQWPPEDAFGRKRKAWS